jgi:acetylornithine aminotransferase
MAKGMGNGFPIAGISIAPHIKPKHFQLGTTFGGNHLACAAALAVLEVIESEKLIENAALIGDHLQTSIRAIPELSDVRGYGLMIGFDYPETLSTLRQRLLFQKHIFTGEAKPRVVRLLPSLALSRSEADRFLQDLRDSIQEIQSAS